MGTNYYARIIPTKERKKELIDLITKSEDFREIKNLVSKTYDSPEYWYDTNQYEGGNIHLGKRSGGWKFLWNPNWYEIRNGHTEWEEVEPGHSVGHFVEEPSTLFKYYDLNKKSIKAFIDREDVEIYDEYEEKQDKEEFWKMALEWVTWTDPNTGEEREAWDAVSYEKYEKSKNPSHRTYDYRTKECEFLKSQGCIIACPYWDFYSDGLRFSTSNQFN